MRLKPHKMLGLACDGLASHLVGMIILQSVQFMLIVLLKVTLLYQNQSRLGHMHLPALGAGYVHLLQAVIGSLCCLHVCLL